MIRRVLVKFSGEALAADDATLDYHRGFEVTKDHPLLSALPLMEWANPRMVLKLALDVKSACEAGLEVALVIGGGNLCRGGRDTAQRAQRAATDKIGMLATAMNGFLLHLALKVAGVGSVVLSARSMSAVCDLYTAERAQGILSSGQVVICVGGSGLPFFSTDTAAVIRACEMRCDGLLKATKVDGVYEDDPIKNPQAVFLEELTHDDCLRRGLKIMDATALMLARDEQLPIIVANTFVPDMVKGACRGGLKKSVIKA